MLINFRFLVVFPRWLVSLCAFFIISMQSIHTQNKCAFDFSSRVRDVQYNELFLWSCWTTRMAKTKCVWNVFSLCVCVFQRHVWTEREKIKAFYYSDQSKRFPFVFLNSFKRTRFRNAIIVDDVNDIDFTLLSQTQKPSRTAIKLKLHTKCARTKTTVLIINYVFFSVFSLLLFD